MAAYLILDMKTGAMNGWYFGKEWAEASIEHLREVRPQGRWVMLEKVPEADRPPYETGIADEMFWSRRLPWPKTA